MKLVAKQNRELIMINAQNTQNENEAEKITLEVPERYEDYNKKIVFITPDGIVWDIITNNEYYITNAITQYGQVDFYIWLTSGDVDYRTQTKTLKFYTNQNASGEITPGEISGVNTVVNLLEAEITKVENMNITATKVGTTTTIDITNKEGQTSSVEIEDGEQGIQGVPGEAGHTPEFGVDYWTPEQQQEIISTATTNTINNYSSTITQIQSNANNALNTANTANTTANTAKSIAEGANQALSYANYQAMVTAFNSLDDDVYRVGQNVMIVTLNVPDLWVSSIESTSASYTYTNDEAITTALSTNGYIQIGYYKLSALETQKVDLTDYYTKTGTENKIEDYLYQIMPTDSTSGAITTIDDATTMFNAVDVTGSIEPVQDLHGQENPYPAGGGKNLFNPQKFIDAGATYTNGKYEATQTIIQSISFSDITFKEDTQYYFYAHGAINSPSSSGSMRVRLTYTDSTVSYVAILAGEGERDLSGYSTSGKTIQSAEFSAYGTLGTYTNWISKFMICEASDGTDYAPYSNICPITGWTGVNIKRTGKNLFNASGMEDSTSWQTDVLTLPSGTYTMSTTKGSLDDTGLYLYFRKTGGSLSSANFVTNTSPVTLTLTSGETAEVVYRKLEGDDSFSNYHYQIELGSTATSYEAYTGETYSIDWTDEAGTVYGGSLDVTTGVLTVDRAMVDLGTLNWNSAYVQPYSVFIAKTNTVGVNSNKTLCSAYLYSGYSIGAIRPDKTINIGVPYFDSQKMTVSVKDTSYIDATVFKTAMSGVQLVYELETPLTYQLTSQQISFLQGTNNLWVNTGDISVTYKADIQKYIDKKTN